MFEWMYNGVDTTIAGTGGKSCVEYVSLRQKAFETIIISTIFISSAYWSWFRLKYSSLYHYTRTTCPQRRVLLAVHCLVFGVELGFKFASSSFIWILNPCHILTMIQIFCLVSDSWLTVYAFRLHIHMMNGPLLALTLPVLNTRFFPFEHAVYFIQHSLIIMIPVCIFNQKSLYSVESMNDPSWVIFALSLQMLYHFWILQPIALITGININNILCPAVSDPFPGPNFRLWAVLHQTALILILGKIYTLFIIRLHGQTIPWNHSSTEILISERDSIINNSTINKLVDSDSEHSHTDLSDASWYWSDMIRYQPFVRKIMD